jgi:small subunit ribosomal protein S19e
VGTRAFHIGADGRQVAWCIVMTTVFDIPAELFNPALAKAMADQDAIVMPDWAGFVKTAVDRERPPAQADWWYARTGAILRKIARNGPIGVTHLAQAFGGKKDNGSMPNTPGVASRHIIRTALQQLEEAGLVEKVPTRVVEGEDGPVQLYAGRSITAAGQKLVDNVAHSIREEAEALYPGLSKY